MYDIVAAEKILLAVTALASAVLLWRFRKPWAFATLFALALAGSVVILLAPLHTLLGGNTGDEQYITAFLMRVMDGRPFGDFYYAGLPVSYPPLYFWIIGAVSAPFASSGIGAAKIGVVLTMLAWFAIPYVALRRDGWMRVLLPLAFVFLLDPYAYILKPYEALSAMLGIVWIGLFARALQEETWGWRRYMTFGVTGGLLLMTYHFWWFLIGPAAALSALLVVQRKRNLRRTVIVGLLIGAVALPYLLPLLVSLRNGSENWQASFFVPEDFAPFMPWASWSLAGALSLVGLAGLVRGRREPFVRAAGITLAACYLWQAGNAVVFLAGGNPILAGKGFLFLGGAALAVGVSRLIVELGNRTSKLFSMNLWRFASFAALAACLMLFPFGRFIDDAALHAHVEAAMVPRGETYLAENIRANVPDWRERTWLTSGTAGLNAYVPLTYFVAHAAHFSHPAAKFSERLDAVHYAASATTPDEFTRRIDARTTVDALALYKPRGTSTYPLLFWVDAFPNGGAELRIDLPRDLVSDDGWVTAKEDDDWIILLRKKD